MKTIYCFAVESGSVGAVEWRNIKSVRDEDLARFPVTKGDRVNTWEMEVPDDADDDTCTQLADEAMWEREYTPTLSYVVSAANPAYDDIVAAQGWNEESELIHLRAFIFSKGLDDELGRYAAEVAQEENQSTVDLGL